MAMPEITWDQIENACLSYRHNFGLLSEAEKVRWRCVARDWLIAWQKTLPIGPAISESRHDVLGVEWSQQVTDEGTAIPGTEQTLITVRGTIEPVACGDTVIYQRREERA